MRKQIHVYAQRALGARMIQSENYRLRARFSSPMRAELAAGVQRGLIKPSLASGALLRCFGALAAGVIAVSVGRTGVRLCN